MNNNVILGVVLLVLLGGGYFYMNNTKPVSTPMPKVEATKTEEKKLLWLIKHLK